MANEAERYWVYASEHVVGPYEAEEIARLPVFTADLPLCRESLLGTAEERWLRAADVPELSPRFPPSLRTPLGRELPKVGPWPPDPETPIDLLGTAERRMEIIDRSLAATQRRLDARRGAYEALKRELAARVAEADGLTEKVKAMGARLGGFIGIEREHEQARAAMAMQDQHAAELRAQVEKLEAQLRELSARPPAPSPEAATAPAVGQAAPVPEPDTGGKPPRQRRRSPPDDFGLPPTTTVDVPDFS